MRLAGIAHAYGDRATLTGVDLGCEPGEVLALLGPNGAGKSTLLAIAAGLVAPTGGEVVLPVLGHRARRALRRSRCRRQTPAVVGLTQPLLMKGRPARNDAVGIDVGDGVIAAHKVPDVDRLRHTR